MPRPRVYQTQVVVLKRQDHGEADRLITFYTPHLGKLRAIAKGVRKPTSRMAGHLELFTQARVFVAYGRNLDIVTQAETVESFRALRDDLVRTGHAFYVAELVDRLTEEHAENEPVFDLLVRTLTRIGDARDPQMPVRFFEMQLLDFLGYRPELVTCLHCHEELPAMMNYFSVSAGGTLCAQCGRRDSVARPLPVTTLKVLRLLQRGDYVTGARLRLDEQLEAEVEAILQAYLIHVLERPPRSVRYLRELRADAVAYAPRPV
ncbi:MAG: DNA repair protein RecO [Chloroflexi bacterium]|nr:DNA repair protein RecO [Chloroflexota bacterium]